MRSSLAQMVAATADYNRRLLQPVACLDKAPSSGSSTEQPVLAMSLVATASAIDMLLLLLLLLFCCFGSRCRVWQWGSAQPWTEDGKRLTSMKPTMTLRLQLKPFSVSAPD